MPTKLKQVQVVKVPNTYLIMQGDSLLASVKREYNISDICKAEGWDPSPVHEFGAWVKGLVAKATPKPKKATTPKPSKVT